MRLQRGDLGLVLAAIAAVALIWTFLARTSDSPAEEEEERPTATTAEPRTGLVRVRSDADPDLEWSSARGAFRVECAEGRVQWLDVKVTRLPVAPRYAWRVVVDADAGETAPLTRRPGVTADLTEGEGLASGFRTTDGGRATVRFTFAQARRDVVVPLVLTVVDVEPEVARVFTAPSLTCRGT